MQLNEYNREQIHHKNEATGLHFEHTSQLKAFIFFIPGSLVCEHTSHSTQWLLLFAQTFLLQLPIF